MDTLFGDFIIQHWSITALNFFWRKAIDEFWFNRCFCESSLRNYKRARRSVLLIHMFSCFFEIAQVYLRSAGWIVYEGHLQNEWVIKTFRKPPKGSKFVSIKSSLQFMHNLLPFRRNYKISRNFSYRFLWNVAQQKTSTQRNGSVKHFKRKFP